MESVKAGEMQACESNEENALIIDTEKELNPKVSNNGNEEIASCSMDDTNEKIALVKPNCGDSISIEVAVEENKITAVKGGNELNDIFHTPDATDSESVHDKCDEEPMNIDEILESVHAESDVVASSDEFCEAQSHADEEENHRIDGGTPLIDEKIETIEQDGLLSVNENLNILLEEESIVMHDSAPENIHSTDDNQVAENSEGVDKKLNEAEADSEKDANPPPKTDTLDELHDNNEIVLNTNDATSTTEPNEKPVDEAIAVTVENTDQNLIVQQGNDKTNNNFEDDSTMEEFDNILEFLEENEEIFAGADEMTNINEVKINDAETEEQSNITNDEDFILKLTENVEKILETNEKSMSTSIAATTNGDSSSEAEQIPEKEVQGQEEQESKPLENSVKSEGKMPVREECLNVDCTKKSEIFHEATEFVINHFHLNKRSKKTMFICDECYDAVVDSYGELCAALEDKQPLFLKNIKYSELVEIIDSSDEEDDDDDGRNDSTENNHSFDAETLALIEDNLETIIKETLEKVDIDQQMDWNRQILGSTVENNEKNFSEMMNEMHDLQSRIDKLYKNTYSLKHTLTEDIQSLDLTTMSITQICNDSYPPPYPGDLKHPDIEYNTLYYTFRAKLTSRWLPCKVTDKIEVNGQTEYTVRFCRERINSTNFKSVLRKHLAYGRVPDYRLNIGTRVIAVFDNTDSNSRDKSLPIKNNFSPGVIAEPLSLYTNWRYLVFFDDGWVQYVHHENIRVVCENTENVWELIEEPGAKTFIEGYVKECKKKRPIVQVRTGQRIQTELNGKWYNAIVNKVEGSLVQVFFEETKRYEWIYRGSTRLFPLYKKLNHIIMSATNRHEATIEYIVIDDDKEPERSTEPPVEEKSQPKTPPSKTATIQRTFASQAARDTPQQKQREQKRAVAKKSTVSQPKPTITHMNNSTIYVDEDKPKGKVVYYTAKKHIDVKKYINHGCKPNCLIEVQHNLTTYSPLSKPLLSGFERQICKTRFNKKYVVYKAPCGRRLRDMPEMHKYLRLTNCKLNVDNFTFDPLIHCLAEYVIESYVMKKPDLSDGIEKMPVQLVNCYDSTMPPPCTYSAKRIPTEGVGLICDSDFLCGCDCTDDCLDKEKCACWKLTLQGIKYGNPDTPIEDVGYQYKRLNEPVPTGIYECNSRCKCKSNCLNRVVQHPIQLKLQVFKTVNRGWGLRCLNDVPKGSFICCYAGNLLTETAANEAGGDLGDEYFAELDYIEVVENMKEGYEPDVVNDENDSSGSEDEDFDVEMESLRTRNDDSDDEFVARSYTASEDSESRRYSTRNSVDKRKKTDHATTKESEKRKERTSSSDEDGDDVRQVKNFMASNTMPVNEDADDDQNKSIRKFFGKNEAVYIMDAKKAGNIGRYFNHSCGPNLFVQNVFVDTHDLRFPWVAFFASTHIRAGTELTWNYNYEVGSVPGKVLICQCGDEKCRGRIL